MKPETLLLFFGGCVWGILYSRSGTLVGVALSHYLIGGALIASGWWPLVAGASI